MEPCASSMPSPLPLLGAETLLIDWVGRLSDAHTGVRIVVPEIDALSRRFRQPQLREACGEIVCGAARLVIVSVFKRSDLARLNFSVILVEPFVQVVELPVSADDMTQTLKEVASMPSVSSEDRSRYARLVLAEWVERLSREVGHRLKSTRASLGASLSGAEPGENPALGPKARDAISRACDALRCHGEEIVRNFPAVAKRVEAMDALLKNAHEQSEARTAAAKLAAWDSAIVELKKQVEELAFNE